MCIYVCMIRGRVLYFNRFIQISDRILWNTIDCSMFVHIYVWLHFVYRLLTLPLFDFKEPSQCICVVYSKQIQTIFSHHHYYHHHHQPLPPLCRCNFLQLTKRQCIDVCVFCMHKSNIGFVLWSYANAHSNKNPNFGPNSMPILFLDLTKTNLLLFQNKNARSNKHRVSHCPQIFTYIRINGTLTEQKSVKCHHHKEKNTDNN